jgi:anti-sigma B factor antagonist
MAVTIRSKQGVTIVDLDGRLTAGGGIALYKTVQGLLDRGVTQILLDLAGIDMMDSSGLGELVQAGKAAQSKGSALKLMRVTDRVQRTLELARMASTFDTFDDEIDALASFRG